MAQGAQSLKNNKYNGCNCTVKFSPILDSTPITNVSIQKHDTVTRDKK